MPPSAGSPRCGSPRGTGPSTATPRPARSAARLTMIAAITAISRPGILRLIARAASTITMTPADTATSAPCTWGSARAMSRAWPGWPCRDGHPQHVGELPGGHLDTDAGEEPDQDGTGQEIRQEPEPGQPGQQQQPASEQGPSPASRTYCGEPATASPARAAPRWPQWRSPRRRPDGATNRGRRRRPSGAAACTGRSPPASRRSSRTPEPPGCSRRPG